MSNNLFSKAFIVQTGETIVGRRIVSLDPATGTVTQRDASSLMCLGVALENENETAGKCVDVMLKGIAEIEAGGAISPGDYITSLVTATNEGKGIVAAPAAGANEQVVGMALEAATTGSFFNVLLSQQQIQG